MPGHVASGDAAVEFDPSQAAALLAAAWRSGDLLDGLPDGACPGNIAQGYDIQDKLAEAIGQEVIGWKLGASSPALKRATGLGRSIAGRIFSSCLHLPGAAVILPNAAPVTIEFEVAYVLGRDILPHEPAFHVPDAIAETRVTFELVLSRFVDRRAAGWNCLTADNVGFQALVLGPIIHPADLPLMLQTLSITLDGEPASTRAAEDDMTDPLVSLEDLIQIARNRQTVLRKGSLVAAGIVSKPVNLPRSAAVVAARYLDQEVGFRTLIGQGNST